MRGSGWVRREAELMASPASETTAAVTPVTAAASLHSCQPTDSHCSRPRPQRRPGRSRRPTDAGARRGSGDLDLSGLVALHLHRTSTAGVFSRGIRSVPSVTVEALPQVAIAPGGSVTTSGRRGREDSATRSRRQGGRQRGGGRTGTGCCSCRPPSGRSPPWKRNPGAGAARSRPAHGHRRPSPSVTWRSKRDEPRSGFLRSGARLTFRRDLLAGRRGAGTTGRAERSAAHSHRRHSLLHLLGRDVLDVGGEGPLVAERVGDLGEAVAPELVGRCRRDAVQPASTACLNAASQSST